MHPDPGKYYLHPQSLTISRTDFPGRGGLVSADKAGPGPVNHGLAAYDPAASIQDRLGDGVLFSNYVV